MRNETYEETKDYLLLMYSTDYSGDIKLPPLKLPLKAARTPLDESLLQPYMFRHKYLEKRCISEPVQRLMGVGYDRQRRAITMPWRLPNGSLANIKYRRVDSKVFWYEKGGLPVRDLVYGIDVIYKKRLDTAVICEGEIDAMSYMTEGIPAIAVGGAAFSDRRKELIVRSPIKNLIISTDNDLAGLQLKEEIIKALCGCITLYIVDLGGYKDSNECLCNGGQLVKCIENSKKVNLVSSRLVNYSSV